MSQTVSVELPSSTLYVSGTVNGVAVTWTNTQGDTWEAEAERAPDDTYQVDLTIVDSDGSTNNVSIVLYFGLLSLITDRTSNDVYRWRTLRDKGWKAMTEEEKAEWLGPMKGAYNYTDMNRVEGAVAYVAGKLNAEGYPVDLVVKTDWKMTDEPTLADMERYYGNVAILREIIGRFPSTPIAPTVREKLTHDGANRLEQILKDVGTLANNLSKSWYYSGDLFLGEV